MKNFILLVVILGAVSCESSKNPEVTVNGALKEIMHQGDISAKFTLKDLENTEHIYALGAVANLKGEILILDSKPLISSVMSGKLRIDESFDHEATLLVRAKVKDWQEITIPDSVRSAESLEYFLDHAANDIGLDTELPFPFLLKGDFSTLDWHVIDWEDGDTIHTHQKHVNSGLHGTLKNAKATILGFYSKHHHTIFTHHSTNVHMHVSTDDGEISGHVDGLSIGENATLMLPIRR